MEWHKITSQEDIDELMTVFHGFKESVITEVSYTSGAFVMPALLMYPVNAKRRVRMVFQHQDKKIPAIEIVFDETNRVNLAPARTNNTAIIEDVYFKKVDDLIYWANTSTFDPELADVDIKINQMTWLRGKRAQWRIIEGHLGNSAVYDVVK